MSKTCCTGDCCQGRNCPNRTEVALGALWYFLSGIGFVAALIAGLCFFGGWE